MVNADKHRPKCNQSQTFILQPNAPHGQGVLFAFQVVFISRTKNKRSKSSSAIWLMCFVLQLSKFLLPNCHVERWRMLAGYRSVSIFVLGIFNVLVLFWVCFIISFAMFLERLNWQKNYQQMNISSEKFNRKELCHTHIQIGCVQLRQKESSENGNDNTDIHVACSLGAVKEFIKMKSQNGNISLRFVVSLCVDNTEMKTWQSEQEQKQTECQTSFGVYVFYCSTRYIHFISILFDGDTNKRSRILCPC